jgi:hypothetical protein
VNYESRLLTSAFSLHPFPSALLPAILDRAFKENCDMANKREFPLAQVYGLLEPGPVVLVTTARAGRANMIPMNRFLGAFLFQHFVLAFSLQPVSFLP